MKHVIAFTMVLGSSLSWAAAALAAQTTFKSSGAIGDGVADDSTAIANALNSGAGTIGVECGNYNLGTTGIVIPNTVTELLMPVCAKLIYSGTGTGVTIASRGGGGNFAISIFKPTAAWRSGSEATSVGIRLANSAFVRLAPLLVQNFATGVQLFSDSAVNQKTVYNTIQLGDLIDNKVGYQQLGDVVNQNQIYGGAIWFSSTVAPDNSIIPNTRDISIINGNTNTFVGTSIEGPTAEISLYVNDSLNQFIGLRYEGNHNSAIQFTSAANNNLIVGGYLPGTIDWTIADYGLNNSILGAAGLRLRGAPTSLGTLQSANQVTSFNSVQVDAYKCIDTRPNYARTWVFGANTGEGHSFGFRDSTGANNVLTLSDGLHQNPYQVRVVGSGGLRNRVGTVSSLPSCGASGYEGTQAAVTDSTTAAWGEVISGDGTNHVLAYCNGMNWTVMAR